MSFFRKLRNKCKYVLMGRREGTWEELEEYDEKKSFSELKDFIDSLVEEGYDYFYLKEVCNNKTRKVWVKSYAQKKRKEPLDIDKLLEIKEKYEKLKELFGGKEVDPYEVLTANIALVLSIRRFCNEFPELCGIAGGVGGGAGRVHDYFSLLREIIMLFSGGTGSLEVAEENARKFLSWLGIKIPQAPTKVRPEHIKRSTESREAVELANRIVSEALKEASNITVSECQVAGVCLEGGEGGE
jgi:hypothetical protein